MTPPFPPWFTELTGRPPHPWQAAIAAMDEPGHRLIRVPTGFGKTLGVLGAWVYHRVVRQDPRWPTRLVWVLPMRTLVEQTEDVVRKQLAELGLLWDGRGAPDGKVGVHVLMGGVDAAPWHNHPGAPAVLIGTQDMLLSRALNRGFGAARARWPMEYGLLSQDALWVLDEVQLMGAGFATALQLAAFRDEFTMLRPCYTWAMSATLQRTWLERSPDTGALRGRMVDLGLQPEDLALPIWAKTEKPVTVLPPNTPSEAAARILDEHAKLAASASLTLVVCNTVERARALHDELHGRVAGTAIHLVHSRFRGFERSGWASTALRRDPDAGSRIVVATQVVEAGVDLSADLLFTELCPWPSFVQRVGRLARRGGRGEVFVLGLNPGKDAAPYEEEDLVAASDALALLQDASPRALQAFEVANPGLLKGLYRYEPEHLLLREESGELFDTTADLSGGDIDVSRYIREGTERDLAVAWVALARDEGGRASAPEPSLRPGRDALCAVPFLLARDWLCGRKSGGREPQSLRPGVAAFLWDYLEGGWRPVRNRFELRPGIQVLVDAGVGGYDPLRGLDVESVVAVAVVEMAQADAQERADAAQDQEDLSQAPWQTIAFHGGAVAAELRQDLERLSLVEGGLGALLDLAARWHDLGKAHQAFQGAIRRLDRPLRADLAKAPADAWSRERCIYRFETGHPPREERRPGFRHELASVLALFDVLLRWAPPEHPSRSGPLAAHFGGEAPRGGPKGAPSPLEREVLDLSADDFDLVAFLVAAHHGKLRARLHASPADQEAAPREGELPIRGVYEGDTLPSVALTGPDGAVSTLPESRLTLEPAALGLSARTGRSWTERVDALRARLGPFALAYLEALLRAADVRASKDAALVDGLLAVASYPTQAEVSP